MSKGPDRIEAAITELFKGTKDRASSVSDITRHGFGLNGAEPTRAQRLSATRAAHRILKRANNAFDAADAAWPGDFRGHVGAWCGPPERPPRDWVAFLIGKDLHCGKTYFFDEEFAAALKATTVWPDYLKAIDKLEPFRDIARRWRTTETKNRQLFFHPADYPVRIWLSRSSRPASSGPKPTELAPSRTGSSP